MMQVPGSYNPFPNLAPGNHRITSPAAYDYNCIAWAAGDNTMWWWPIPGPRGSYWPTGIARQETLASFQAAFEHLGYAPCSEAALELGIEKIAIYADAAGVPTHAARQLPTGYWTSKLGPNVDIIHIDLAAIEGPEYGRPAL